VEAVEGKVGDPAHSGSGGVAADLLCDAGGRGGFGLSARNDNSDVSLRRTNRGDKAERAPVQAVIDFG
jgi:hypothetical protein